MPALLCLLLLVPAPKAPPSIQGCWVVEWGTIKPYYAEFHGDRSYDSDEPWGSGDWWIEDAGIVFRDKTGIWIISGMDWRTMEGDGRRIGLDGFPDGQRVKVKLKRPPVD